MTVRDDFDRMLSTWLDETAGAGAPDYLDETLDGLARIGQRPAWMSPGRWLPMQLTMPRVVVPRALPILAVIVLLIAALTVAALITGSQRRVPPPFGLAATGLFVYDSRGDIYVRDAHGQPRLLIGGPEVTSAPIWSRDGAKVAFWTGEPGGLGEVRVSDASGSDVTTVASDVRLPSEFPYLVLSWSPDSRRLAFASGMGQLEIVDTDGTSRRTLGSDALLRFDPAWSPDGSLVAFRGQERTAMDAPRRAYVIRPDGTGEQPVSALSGGFNTMLGLNWSGDGRLVYDVVYDQAGGAGDVVVATKGPDGWSEKVIVPGALEDWLPRWSNDGTRIVFLRSRTGMSEGDLFIVNADGSGLRRISDRIMSTAGACWTPDDTGIAAITGEPGQPINGQEGATYILFDVDLGTVRAEMPAPGAQGLMTCSWQRLAP